MSYPEAIFLGIVQGLTEFLPVSSSGHLIAVRSFFGLDIAGTLGFDVLVHIATFVAIIVYFRRDVFNILKMVSDKILSRPSDKNQERMFRAVVFGVIPAVVIGLMFEDFLENVARAPMVVVFSLLIGSLFFAIAEVVSGQEKNISGLRGFFVGCFQALALIPGFSRSGVTIAGGLLVGLKRQEAIRFSFLLGLPVIAGAGGRVILNLSDYSQILSPQYLLGALTSFLVGLLAVHFLFRFLSRHRLTPFIIYRTLLAVLLFFFLV